LIERTARNDKGPANCGNLFDLFFQGGASSWIHMMDLMAYRTGHRLINVAVLGGVFGGEALNAVSSLWAAVHVERHAID
jgi:hypothetical protein